MSKRKIRVLIAKPGLDGHDRGVKVLAQGLRDSGMEVIYLGLRLTPKQIAEAAIQEDVDIIGLSCLSGAHINLFSQTVQLIREKGNSDIQFIGGGIIPKEDIPKLREIGIAGIFGPGTPIATISKFIEADLKVKDNDNKDKSYRNCRKQH